MIGRLIFIFFPSSPQSPVCVPNTIVFSSENILRSVYFKILLFSTDRQLIGTPSALFWFVSISVLDKFCDHLWTKQLKIGLRADIIYRFTDLLPTAVRNYHLGRWWHAVRCVRCRWHLLMMEHLAKSIHPLILTPRSYYAIQFARRTNSNNHRTREYTKNKKSDWRIENERNKKKGQFFLSRWYCWLLLLLLILKSVCLQNII